MNESIDQTEVDENVTAPQPKSWRRRLVRAVVIYAVIPYVAVVLIFTGLQRTFLYPATKEADLSAGRTSLEDGTIHDLSLIAQDGIELKGWVLLAEGRIAQSERELDAELNSERTTLLYFPGNSGNRLVRIADLRELTRRNLNVICFDYRGYGDTSGEPSEKVIVEDAWAVWELVNKEKAIPAENMLLFGESLGGGVAVQIAARASREGTPPAALILSSTFLSMEDNVQKEYPFFPVKLMLWDTWRSDRFAEAVDCPVVMFHGTADEFVPLEAARTLFKKFPEPENSAFENRWIEIERGEHNDIPPMLLRSELDLLLRSLAQEDEAQ